MLFDRFNVRERGEEASEGVPIAELPSETQGYSLTLGARHVVFLIGGYCFLCVLVFALGVVIGRAISQPEPGSDAKESRASLPKGHPARDAQDVLSSKRIPLIPQEEPRNLPAGASETMFSPSPIEPPTASKDVTSQVASQPAKPPRTPEASPSSGLSAVASSPEEKRGSEARRSATTERRLVEPVVSRTAPGLAGDYTIQVSSFRSVEQASELKGRLSKKGYAAYVQSVDLSDKGTWHRVRVGSFRDKDGAEQVASEIRSRENLPALVTRR